MSFLDSLFQGNHHLTYGQFVVSFEKGYRFQKATTSFHQSMNHDRPLAVNGICALTALTLVHVDGSPGLVLAPLTRCLIRLGKFYGDFFVMDLMESSPRP